MRVSNQLTYLFCWPSAPSAARSMEGTSSSDGARAPSLTSNPAISDEGDASSGPPAGTADVIACTSSRHTSTRHLSRNTRDARGSSPLKKAPRTRGASAAHGGGPSVRRTPGQTPAAAAMPFAMLPKAPGSAALRASPPTSFSAGPLAPAPRSVIYWINRGKCSGPLPSPAQRACRGAARCGQGLGREESMPLRARRVRVASLSRSACERGDFARGPKGYEELAERARKKMWSSLASGGL